MPLRTWQRNEVYRKRLIILTPIAAILVASLFLISDEVDIQDIEKTIGWKGEMRVLPDITIIPDNEDIVAIEQQRKLKTMTTVDLDLVDGEGYDSPELQSTERPEEEEIVDLDEFDEFQVRTVKMSREVPYSEDYVILKMVEPEYPPEELQKGIEGNVLVELFVNERGEVESAQPLTWTGPESFRLSTMAAVKQFIFKPPMENGKPQSMWIKFVIRFRIYG